MLFSISMCIFVLAESAISSGANGVISRHGCGDQSFAEVIYLQATSDADGKISAKETRLLQAKAVATRFHVYSKHLLPRLMRL